jgi:futalosine hydrolase
MLLLVAATEMEMAPVRKALGQRNDIVYLVTGAGPLETALHLTRFLVGNRKKITKVMNIGVAGAYIDSGPQLLDICLAERELLGDFGICGDGEIVPFVQHDLQPPVQFDLQSFLLKQAEEIFVQHDIQYSKGSFVTVNCTSGTAARGLLLRDRYKAICDNMEGAAVARVCGEFGIFCLEVRCVSNMVEDRDVSNWRLAAAAETMAAAAALLVNAFLKSE